MDRVGAVRFSLGVYSVLGLGSDEVSKAGFIEVLAPIMGGSFASYLLFMKFYLV